jgi:hypothetical protein
MSFWASLFRTKELPTWDSNGLTPLQKAAKDGNVASLRKLLFLRASQQMLPGRLNPVKFRKGQAANIAEAIFQVKGEIDSLIFQYYSILTQTLELLVGTPPQIFGAGTQDGVETKGGQQQQLNTGMQKLGLQWKFVGDENAEASKYRKIKISYSA